VDLPGNPAVIAAHRSSSLVEPGAEVQRLATGFFNLSGAAVDGTGELYFIDEHWQRIYHWWSEAKEAVVVRTSPLGPENLAFDRAGDLLVVSKDGKGSVYAFKPDAPQTEMEMLWPEHAQEHPEMTVFLASSTVTMESLSQPRPWQYISPDHTVFIPAGDDFVEGQMSLRAKKGDILRTYGLAKAQPGHPFYVTDGADERTYQGSVTTEGTLDDVKLFAEKGGDSLAIDEQGNVYLAAGQILIYNPEGKQIDTIRVPERPIDLIFGGADGRTLYILARTSLYAVRTRNRGL
jgi:sugar lactone lactonase YvrE